MLPLKQQKFPMASFAVCNSPTVCEIGAMVNTQGSLERGLRILSASSIEIWLCQEGGWQATIC